jgi:putative N6-adenine-specific DNA methylase
VIEKLFAVCAPGLEPFTALELNHLGLLSQVQKGEAPESVKPARAAQEEAGGVSFSGDLKAIYLANLHLRTTSRVLVRLGEFYAAAFSELRKKAARLAWERYLRPGQPVAIHVTCHHSRLYHSDAVAERIAGAIGDCLGQSPQVMKYNPGESHSYPETKLQPQVIIVRLVYDLCTISVDSSGELLHRRGYRLATAKAPLRETLAAGMLLGSGWDRISSLVDPFCGSGTIAIEAAMLALGIAPGRSRRFAFMEWQNFDPALWDNILKENSLQMKKLEKESRSRLDILASDRDAGAVQMAQANASRIGVEQQIEFSCRAVSAIEPAGIGWVVTNPPYGLRVSANKDLRNLYAQFGKVLKSKCLGWQVAILCNDFQLLRSTGLQLDASLSFVNGGIPVRLARGIVRV